jgi:RNase H-fold protein (predicted Holliday junction resolvase)
MRLIGLDLGSKSMGIAITDSQQTIVSGLENF